ncbi:MAG: SIS domain-containing protein [Smithella sp.]|nr:SIS domain-containing protein [Smithella sp.]
MIFQKKIFLLFQNFILFIRTCRLYVGRCPNDVAAPALIFFPILSCQMNCGFAGIMTCRLQNHPRETTSDLIMARLWEKAKSAKVKSADLYLGGTDTISAMQTAVLNLKREDAQAFLFFHTARAADLSGLMAEMKLFVTEEEKWLEDQAALINSSDLESVNGRLLLLKDIGWALEKDILANIQKVLALSGSETQSSVTPAAFRKYRKLNLALNALDRLEVRGRDSAGIQLSFAVHNETQWQEVIRQIEQKNLADDYKKRSQKGDLLNENIFVSRNSPDRNGPISIAFTYKTFSIVGELGRNVADLRHSIQTDRILQCFAGLETTGDNVLTHTRWASVGSITEENCHPVNNYAINHTASSFPFYPDREAQINVVLNGDVDNYAQLRQSLEKQSEMISQRITTDTKIIPLQIEKYLNSGENLTDAFRLAVNDFRGSHAIAMTSNLEPDKMFLALQGSGQSVYLGFGEDQCMFSSELYGVVEVTPHFLKMNGENGGQIFILDQNCPADIEGVSAFSYDGRTLTLTKKSGQTAEITTRDIDRGAYPHFFLKEICESALSVKRTLRGKYHISSVEPSAAHVAFNLGEDMVPATVRTGLKKGLIRNIVVIGHGTAAVAGQAVADSLSHYLEGRPLNISSRVASELSGFGLKDDLCDTLIIPITQSGTTTDTNRAVAMARERGAQVIAIVNRRQSDITATAQGVFYTSDGRDIEMSVASSKAFYAQIVAGHILALFFAQLLGTRSDDDIARALRLLESAPLLMDKIFSSRAAIAASVQKAVTRKHWAIVGSGPNKAAADEIRIKLSELCYKTISSDTIENKKHIDLSAEPFILVCAAGNPEPVAADAAKDVAIFKAHKAATVVFADEGDSRFHAFADQVIAIPAAPSPLPVILNAMAGHLWGYYAALAVDAEAQIFRQFRGGLTFELAERNHNALSVFDLIADASLQRVINGFFSLFNARRQEGGFVFLEGKTITDLTLLLKYASGKLPLQDIRQDFNCEKDLFSPYDLLDETLGKAIDELTRPIDAIRHQAKTVTVGTSRKEKEPEGIIFDLLQALKFNAGHLSYRDVQMIRRVQPAISSVPGYTLYDISALDDRSNPAADSMIVIRVKAGIAASMTSRADKPTELMGVKRTIVSTGHAYVGRGKTDRAPIMIIPLRTRESAIGNLLLLHIRFNESLNLQQRIAVLGYRYNDIRNLIDEYNLAWNDRFLEAFSLESLFSEPVDVIAGHIKAQRAP